MATTPSLCTGPQTLDWRCAYAGDTVQAAFRLLADGDPWDLTGATLTAQARRTSSDPDPAALTATVTVTDVVGGVALVKWDGEAIRALLGDASAWEGVWDMQVVEAGGTIRTVVAGRFIAAMDVTR